MKLILALILSLLPSSWQFSATVPMAPYATAGAVAFNFPVEDGTHPTVNYFWTPVTHPISGSVTATFQTVATQGTIFNYVFEPGNTCVFPAHVRFIIARADYMKQNNRLFEYTRWWSQAAVTLTGGPTVTLSVPLTPDQWTDIYGGSGSQNPIQFANMLQKPAMVGFSFGGGCFYGHGVNVSNGNATFAVSNLEVN